MTDKKNMFYSGSNSKTNIIYPLILMYHRIEQLKIDLGGISVSPENFEKHIKYLKKYFNIIKLQDLIADLSGGIIPDRSVVITFDDGYSDNLYNAKKILEKYDVPATFFITGGMIDSKREYRWDELEKILLLNTDIPGTLDIGYKKYTWTLRKTEDLKKAYNQIELLLKTLPAIQRDRIVDCLFNSSGANQAVRNTHRLMTEEELRELHRSDLIEIGAHTMSHCSLSLETEERQLWEIKESKRLLEDMLECQVNSFAYPFGNFYDVSARTKSYVKQAGFNCSMSTVCGNISANTDLFWMPRHKVINYNLNEFQNYLNKIMHISSGNKLLYISRCVPVRKYRFFICYILDKIRQKFNI
jgi:peptidoglycan/xylan/chitin deacetylase (PgdA/CDA1 family)